MKSSSQNACRDILEPGERKENLTFGRRRRRKSSRSGPLSATQLSISGAYVNKVSWRIRQLSADISCRQLGPSRAQCPQENPKCHSPRNRQRRISLSAPSNLSGRCPLRAQTGIPPNPLPNSNQKSMLGNVTLFKILIFK